jgi:putative flavoprotein involved in K+ transport
MTRDEVVAWLAGYAPTFGPPLREHTKVTSLTQRNGGGFLVEAEGPDGAEAWEVEHVVVATGGYHVPVIPAWAPALDPAIDQLHSADYRSASRLRPGGVLVVGSGQSGAQIAEDLHLEGRQVHLAIGDAPRVARFHRGRDCMTWLAEMGLYDTPVTSYPGGPAAREKTNHYVTGRDGGRDIDLRQFAAEGMRLYGRLASGFGADLVLEPTLREALGSADDVYRSICRDIDAYIASRDLDVPPRGALPPGLGAGVGSHRARSRHGRSLDGDLGDRLPARLPMGPGGCLRRRRTTDPHPGRHRDPRTLLPRPALAAHLGLGALPRHRRRRGAHHGNHHR